eukprot:PhM_4_TR2425/c0_g1_i2/m.38752
MFKAMDMLSQPFVGCKEDWTIVYYNMEAKKLLHLHQSEGPANLSKLMAPDVMYHLRVHPNSIRVANVYPQPGQYFAVRLVKSASPHAQNGAVYWVCFAPVPETSIPHIYESSFSPQNVLSQKLTLAEVNFRDRRVVMRADFNVPMSKKDGSITDDFRI